MKGVGGCVERRVRREGKMGLTYVMGLCDGQGCATRASEGGDPYPRGPGCNPSRGPTPDPRRGHGCSSAPVPLHVRSRARGRPNAYQNLCRLGCTVGPTLHRPVPAERSRGPQCTHFYCLAKTRPPNRTRKLNTSLLFPYFLFPTGLPFCARPCKSASFL